MLEWAHVLWACHVVKCQILVIMMVEDGRGVGTGEGRGVGEAGQMGSQKTRAEGRMETKTENVPEHRAPSLGVDSPSLLHVSREKGAGSLQERQHTEGRMAAWED